jgi:hypothetical protein
MTNTKPVMAQDNFSASAGPPKQLARADFSSDEGALAYAEAQLDTLVEAMRYSLRKQIAGWPDDDPSEALSAFQRSCGRWAKQAADKPALHNTRIRTPSIHAPTRASP